METSRQHPGRSPQTKSRCPALAGLFLLITVAATQTCCFNDPFDPWLGPRNARPAASRYLLTRNDIPESEKLALLGYQPCALRTLTRFQDAPVRELRFLVGVNSGADLSILQPLAADKDSAVRQGVALNRNTPNDLVLKLSKDPNANVRWTAENRRLEFGANPAVGR
jgi:hypothetical protein